MTETIRTYRDADFEGVVALWRACDILRPWNPPAEDIARCRTSRHGEVLVADEAERIIGAVMVGHDGHRGWLYAVAVHPDRQRTGLGRRIVGAAEAWLAARGVPKAMLMIRETNAPVRAFYETLGYGEEPRLVMSKWLTPRPQ